MSNRYAVVVFIVALAFISCSRKNNAISDSPRTQTPTTGTPTQWAVYQSTGCPISFNYPVIPAHDEYGFSKTIGGSDKADCWARVFVDLRNEFPVYQEENDDSENLVSMEGPVAQVELFDIGIYSKREEFAEEFHDTQKWDTRDSHVGQVPSIELANLKTGEVLKRVPLVPGYYPVITDAMRSGYDGEGGAAVSKRVYELTQRILDSFRWNQSIDTDSQEFKAWKAHILSLIEESRKRPTVKTNILSP